MDVQVASVLCLRKILDSVPFTQDMVPFTWKNELLEVVRNDLEIFSRSWGSCCAWICKVLSVLQMESGLTRNKLS